MSYVISMPHRHTVTYEEGNLKIVFEVDPYLGEITLYINSPKILGDASVDLTSVIDKVKSWLEEDYKVILDNTPPPVFNLE